MKVYRTTIKSVEDLMNDWGAGVLEGLRGREESDEQRAKQVKRHKKRGTRHPFGWRVPRENRIVKPKSVIRS